jgi:hydroxymethylpyrimidine pyrophosphatase-like HAD family hydrolase
MDGTLHYDSKRIEIQTKSFIEALQEKGWI